MTKLECEFYPGNPAVWRCKKCSTRYGSKCIPVGCNRYWPKRHPTCIRCSGELRYLGAAAEAKSRWKMRPYFLLYPLHPNGLIVLGTVMSMSFFINMTLVAAVIGLITALIVVKYGLAIVEQRGSGKTTAPEISVLFDGSDNTLLVRQLILFALMGVAIAGSGYTHLLFGILVAGLVSFIMPASTLILVEERNLSRSLNLFEILNLVFTVKWTYIGLWALAQVLSLCLLYVASWFTNALPQPIVMVIFSGVTVYLSFILFSMIGYVLSEYRLELGFDSGSEEDKKQRWKNFQKTKALGESAVYMYDRKFERARSTLRSVMDLLPDDVDLHLQYHQLLMMLKDDKTLASHCNYLVGLLKDKNSLGKAVDVLVGMLSRISDFKLVDTRAAIEIARLMRKQGRYTALVRLLNNIHLENPREPLIPEAYLLVASTFFESLKDDVNALAVTQYVLAEFPMCPQRAQFQKLKEMIGAHVKESVSEMS